MKKNKYLLLLILFIIACNPAPIDLEYVESEIKPVVNSVFKAGEKIELELSTSRSFYAKDTIVYINNALCILWQNNNLVDTFDFLNNGKYQSHIKAIEGAKYKLQIKQTNFETINADSYIPDLQEMKFKLSNTLQFIPNELRSYRDAYLEITDNDSDSNYYQFFSITFRPDHSDSNNNYFISHDPSVLDENLLPLYNNGLIFTDKLFNQQKHKISFGVDLGYLSDTTAIIVTKRIVSEDYYKYLKSIILQDNSNGDMESLFTGVPINLYTNISNAYGIFAGYCEQIDTIYIYNSKFN